MKAFHRVSIGKTVIHGNVFLAPMAGVTDKVFRQLCREMGAALSCTEMVSAKGLKYKSPGTEKLLERASVENPACVQLFGSDPVIMAEQMKALECDSIHIFDINMGCPAPKIVKNNEGSALMNDPLLVGRIVGECAKAVSTPVTVKIRKGFDRINAVEIAKICEASGATAITVHGRTRDEFYSGKADIDIIKQVKEAVKIPVIGNGDITDGTSALNMLEYTGCDAVMIGRAAMGNPFIFREINHFLDIDEELPKATDEEKYNMAIRHTEMLIDFKGEYTALREMRSHLGWYIKGTKGAALARTEINKADTKEKLFEILKRVFIQ